MPKFEKGRPKTGGRQKGAPTRSLGRQPDGPASRRVPVRAAPMRRQFVDQPARGLREATRPNERRES